MPTNIDPKISSLETGLKEGWYHRGNPNDQIFYVSKPDNSENYIATNIEGSRPIPPNCIKYYFPVKDIEAVKNNLIDRISFITQKEK